MKALMKVLVTYGWLAILWQIAGFVCLAITLLFL